MGRLHTDEDQRCRNGPRVRWSCLPPAPPLEKRSRLPCCPPMRQPDRAECVRKSCVAPDDELDERAVDLRGDRLARRIRSRSPRRHYCSRWRGVTPSGRLLEGVIQQRPVDGASTPVTVASVPLCSGHEHPRTRPPPATYRQAQRDDGRITIAVRTLGATWAVPSPVGSAVTFVGGLTRRCSGRRMLSSEFSVEGRATNGEQLG